MLVDGKQQEVLGYRAERQRGDIGKGAGGQHRAAQHHGEEHAIRRQGADRSRRLRFRSQAARQALAAI